jgi:hypothetical protein
MRRLSLTLIPTLSTLTLALTLAFGSAAQEAPRATASSDKAAADKVAADKAAADKVAADKTAADKANAPKAEPPSGEASVWMRKKLDYSQQILEGIAEADFDRIATNAQAMRALGKVEGFVRGRTPGYRSQLQIFQDATEQLIKHAEKDNVDGAALAFTQLTISCVNCHKHLREGK